MTSKNISKEEALKRLSNWKKDKFNVNDRVFDAVNDSRELKVIDLEEEEEFFSLIDLICELPNNFFIT